MFSMRMARSRDMRLSSGSTTYDINPQQNLNEHTVMESIGPLQHIILDKPKTDHLINLLNYAVHADVALENKISGIIANGVVPGIVDLRYFEERMSNIIPDMMDDNAAMITESINENLIYDRIISNNQKLSKRFNFSKIIAESTDVSECIHQLCEMLDTYSTPDYAKYNIALENILYSYSMSGKPVTEEFILEAVTDYFLLREDTISDATYKGLGRVLKRNKFYTEAKEVNTLAKTLIDKSEHDGVYARKIAILADKAENETVKNIISSITDIRTEQDAHNVIEHIGNISNLEDISDDDRGLLYGAVKIIPLVTGISDEFVCIEIDKCIDVPGSKFDQIEPVLIADNDEELVKPKALGEMTTKELENMVFTEAFDNDDMNKLIAQYKAEQKKTVPGFKRLVSKMYSKSPEAMISEVPNILHIASYAFIAAEFTIPVIGPVLAIISGMITWFISKRVSEKDAQKLLDYLKAEKAKVEKKLDTISNPKAKIRYGEYLKELDKSIEKVSAYLESIVGDSDDSAIANDSDVEGMDFDDMDIDEATLMLHDLVVMTEQVVKDRYCELSDENIDISLCNITENADIDNWYVRDTLNRQNEDGLLSTGNIKEICEELMTESYSDFSDFVEILSKSSYRGNGLEAIHNLYESTYYSEGGHHNVANSYASSAQNIFNETTNTNKGDIQSLIEEYYCNEAVKKILKKVPHPNNVKIKKDDKDKHNKPKMHFNLNSVKLILQDAKRNIKNLNTKIQSKSQAANAYASGVINGIEKSMTSDRREAIIKGRILPSFSQMVKYAVTIAAAGVAFQPLGAVITAVGLFSVNKALTYREKQMILDEIETEMRVVEKQIAIAENEGDMDQYRLLLNMQKKLIRERQRIKYNMKAVGKNVPIPSTGKTKFDD